MYYARYFIYISFRSRYIRKGVSINLSYFESMVYFLSI
ncbi:unnamed protein product [Paramecium octaurelia]|uniref:Uncharacterized protein n=1 Tax=Paramecium octaurelia TaxID=43137 RepID=A0A8S1S3K6_PAROT|nr:unnamed protein product [Paramecium octaurelia]